MRKLAMAAMLSTAAVSGPALADDGAPPPPPATPAPVPPPVAAPSRQPPAPPVGPFIVFFDWGNARVTSQSAAILDNVAAAYRSAGTGQVILAGNTDRSGAASDNARLSRRRADHVRAYLVSSGVPKEAVSIQANGEDKLLVDTADGAREPQNRNVQIFFKPAFEH